MDRLNLPFQFFEYEMEEEVWLCSASSIEVELYLLLEGLEKFTEALKVVPGRDLLSWECDHLTLKFLVCMKSFAPFSPVWSLDMVSEKLPPNL